MGHSWSDRPPLAETGAPQVRGKGAPRPPRAAIVLAGGRSRRMGTDKLALRLGKSSLLERAVVACAGHADVVVVAGPRPPSWSGPSHVAFVVEDPPFGGPAAGIAAALAHLAASWDARAGSAEREVLILAGDLENPRDAVELLVMSALGEDGTILRDIEGWPQYLAGRYKEPELRNIYLANFATRDVSIRRLMGGLRVKYVAAPSRVTRDLDTPDQAFHAGIALEPDHGGG